MNSHYDKFDKKIYRCERNFEKKFDEKICDEKKFEKTKRSTMNIVVIKRFLTKFFEIVVDERIDKSIKFKLIISTKIKLRNN